MKLVICGDSHAEVLAWARSIIAKDSPELVDDVAVGPFGNGRYLGEPFFNEQDGTIKFIREDYAANYEALAGGPLRQSADIVHGFSMGFHTAPLFLHATWRSHVPWRLSSKLGMPPVSDSVVVAMADHIWRYMREFYATAIRLKIRFFVIAAPPPRRSHVCIQQGTAPETVIEVDRIFRDSVAKWLTERGITYIVPPKATIDSEGFMLPQYEPLDAPRDYHHGNESYGVVALREILEQISWEEMRRLGQPAAEAGIRRQ
jgi:hypothetical protein